MLTKIHAGEALDDLFQLEISRNEWRKLQPTSTPTPTARYDMGFVAASNNKIYLVGGKLSAWTTGASQYSWSDSAELDSEYSKDKGNDDLWELNYQADPPTWTKRVQSLYATMCSAEWTSGSASATFCENFLGQCHTCSPWYAYEGALLPTDALLQRACSIWERLSFWD